jgi:hypothetical protein
MPFVQVGAHFRAKEGFDEGIDSVDRPGHLKSAHGEPDEMDATKVKKEKIRSDNKYLKILNIADLCHHRKSPLIFIYLNFPHSQRHRLRKSVMVAQQTTGSHRQQQHWKETIPRFGSIF